MLPADLRAAEAQALQALRSALNAEPNGRWTLEWRFEGLRLLAPVLRLRTALTAEGRTVQLLFPDAGAAALARRESTDQDATIFDMAELLRRQPTPSEPALILAVAPAAADYEAFEAISQRHQGGLVMINGRLEDAAIGIGSVGRERRRGFLARWQTAYLVQPLAAGALRRAYPDRWEIYREDPDGFRRVADFERKPDPEQQLLALNGAAGGDNLGAIDAFIEGLRS
ncbi:MAG: DUF1995 family protein [Cyanobacteriota bacterium]|nr:DUF1995 family protein [Cyanobacteriota bacterium]